MPGLGSFADGDGADGRQPFLLEVCARQSLETFGDLQCFILRLASDYLFAEVSDLVFEPHR